MAKSFAKQFYNSKKWKDLRFAYIALRWGICERCGKSNAKQVHHKKYLTPENIYDSSITLSFDNLELLCDECHQREHNEKYSPLRCDLEFNSNGNIIKKPKTQS